MPPGHLSVDVTADSSTTTIDVADPADPVEADLVAVLSELATAAMHEPLAVVRLTVEAKRFPPEMNLPSRLVFRLDGEGSMATRWRLDAEGSGGSMPTVTSWPGRRSIVRRRGWSTPRPTSSMACSATPRCPRVRPSRWRSRRPSRRRGRPPLRGR
jgi:hypothetical protein